MYFNAHAHVELSFLRGALPSGIGFVDWLQQLVWLKRTTDPQAIAAAATVALDEIRQAKTSALLDIDTMGVTPGLLGRAPFPVLSFTEMIAIHPDQADDAVARALDRQARYTARARKHVGLSPHAPYTTTPRLILSAQAQADRLGQWMCIHAAETREETEMILHGRGPLHDFLRDIGALPDDWSPAGLRPIPYLATLGALGPQTLLVHCNDIDDADIRIMATAGCHVVVCPGTHVFFAREEFPLARLLDAGIPVHLGTDSLASNKALDMAREVRLACELAPSIDPRRIEQMAMMTDEVRTLFFEVTAKPST
jgi:cytosine/adenosine deaminase-related metal-dependent hydrolase